MTSVRLLLILLGLNAILGLGLAYAWLGGEDAPIRKRWVPPVAIDPDPRSLRALTLPLPQADAGDEILSRPIFSLDRRAVPAAESGGEEAPSPAPLSELRIHGFVKGAGFRAVIGVKGGKAIRIPLDGTIEGWRLVAIEGEEAVFRAETGEERRLSLIRVRAPAATTPAPRAMTQGSAPAAAPSPEDLARERLARRNALRQEHGLPSVER